MLTLSAGYPFSDLILARRLEHAEARANAAFVDARALLQPDTGATWCNVAGAYAMFDGVASPLTQSFGLGLFDPVGDAELDRLEAFFRERGASTCHEVSPMAPAALLARLGVRGYRPVELTSVMYRPIAPGDEGLRVTRVRVRRIEPGEADVWADVAAEGWGSESAELAAFMRTVGQVSARAVGTHCFLAELDGTPIAAAALSLRDDVALLAGASTAPRGRRQGAQLALLDARLRFAAARDCRLAMVAAAPGSASQRNAERQGFRIAYTRVKWQLQDGRGG